MPDSLKKDKKTLPHAKSEKVSKFAQKLSELRKERGISQKKAAMELGISQALLSHYEKGIRECGLDFVIRCSEYYGVTTDYLLGVSDSRLGVSNLDVSAIESESGSFSDIINGIKYMFDILGAVNESTLTSYVADYCILCAYRGALTMAKAGILPKEMFKIDYNLGRELASASIAVQDARFVLIEDKSRTGKDIKEDCAVSRLIEIAEENILNRFYLE